MKKRTSINIDADLLEKAKREIPSISKFLTECLEIFLGVNDAKIADMQTQIDIIKKAKLEIYLLSQIDNNVEINENYDKDKINGAWIKLWGEYRRTSNINEKALNEISQMTGKPQSFFINLVEGLDLFVPKTELSLCDDYEHAVNQSKYFMDK